MATWISGISVGALKQVTVKTSIRYVVPVSNEYAMSALLPLQHAVEKCEAMKANKNRIVLIRAKALINAK
jgi:hypothetical protein